MLCAIIGLAFAFCLILAIMRHSSGNERMREISAAVQEGAKAYLNRQVKTISVIGVVIFILLFIFKDHPTAIGFVIGAFCSLAAGFIGMRVAVLANVRTAQAASIARLNALRMGFNGGAVTGLLVVGLALLSVSIFYTIAAKMIGSDAAIHSLVGLALGGSLISVFARLGGGIYTKAADVGADLVGKIESGLEEDDPRNPAVIADNVGDNVGDCAGMAADVFETYAVSLIGAILVGVLTLAGNPSAIVYPFVLGGISVLGAICGVLFVNVARGKPGRVLMGAVLTNALISAILFWPVTHRLFPAGLTIAGTLRSPAQLYFASLVGLIMTPVIVALTNYYTSSHYGPVQKIAHASETGHATNIIAGLAAGEHATALPVLCIGAAILVTFHLAGLYGIAIAVMSMLSMAGIIISLDSFGPITDNAGGVAVMSNLPKEVRAVTDELDAVGNTMKAVTKGYAIASAGSFFLSILAHRTKSDHRTFHRRIAAVHFHRIQHGRRRQSGWRGRARGAQAIASEARNFDWPGQAGIRNVRGHRDESCVAGNDRSCVIAIGCSHCGRGRQAARRCRARWPVGRDNRNRIVYCHRNDFWWRRVG